MGPVKNIIKEYSMPVASKHLNGIFLDSSDAPVQSLLVGYVGDAQRPPGTESGASCA
jgi:hypothetical protein